MRHSTSRFFSRELKTYGLCKSSYMNVQQHYIITKKWKQLNVYQWIKG